MPEQPYSLHPYAYVNSNPALFIDPSGKCLGWLWRDPSCQFAGTDYTKYDYVGAGQVVVTGLGGLAAAVACVGTAGFVCAAGAGGAAAVASWGNQALGNAGQPVTQAAISNVNWGAVTLEAAVAAASVPVGGLVAKGLGKFGSATANAVRAYSDLHLSRILPSPPPESGITELMARAISKSLRPGQILATRGRAVGSDLYDFAVPGRYWTLPCKPEGAKTLGENLPNGVRFVVTKDNAIDLVVSDLDTAWLVQNKVLADKLEELGVNRSINDLYQVRVTQHPSHVLGVEEGKAPIKQLGDDVYLFSSQSYIGTGKMLDTLEQFAPSELPRIENLRALLRSVRK